MFKISCRCGKTQKNFKKDIGPFFINKCCLEAGFDKLGNKEGEEEESPEDKGQDSESNETLEGGQEDEGQAGQEEANAEIAQGVEMTNAQAQEAKEEPEYDKMTAKAMITLLKERKIKFTKKDTREVLISRLNGTFKK